jgi:hypothetical protein
MKSKLLVLLSTLVFALGMLAQNATPTTPPATGTAEKACACCDHGKTPDGKAACVKGEGCCGKDAKCCAGDMMASKDGKEAKACPMMSKNKDGKSSCCAEGKCPMMAKGKGKGCCGGQCGAAATTTQSKASCCSKGAACCAKNGACCMGTAVSASAATVGNAGCCDGM